VELDHKSVSGQLTAMGPFMIAALLDVAYLKNMGNAATTAVTEARNVAEKCIEECKMVAARAEDNYRAWYSFVPLIVLMCKYYVL
jgi:hypothetical protein